MLVAGLVFSSVQTSPAALLKSAEVTAVVNDVKVVDPTKGERPAGVKDVVRGDVGLKTGLKSRAELLFQDKTLTRLGANTLFSFNQGTRELELERGTMLLQVPKNVGGAKIRTAAVTAAITGTTILLEYSPVKWKPRNPPGVSPDVVLMAPEQSLLELQNPKRRYSAPDLTELRRKAALARKNAAHVKVMVLEGTLRLYLNNRVGESVLIGPGEMIILSPTALTIPPSVNFDIAQLARTSLLVNNANWPTTRSQVQMAQVARQIAIQEKSLQGGDLQPTNLVIFGSGTEVFLTTPDMLTVLNLARTAAPFIPDGSRPAGDLQKDGSSGSSGEDEPATSGSADGGGTSVGTNLPGFLAQGSTTVTTGSPPVTSAQISSNFTIATMLPGAVPVTPTEGSDFLLFSTAGTDSGSGSNLTGTQVVGTVNIPAVASGQRQALNFDYRFLTDEISQGASFVDQFLVTIVSGDNSFELSLDRDALRTAVNVLSPVAQAGVGGFQGGTDWLPFSLDLTPLAGSAATVSFFIFDVGDSVVDSAFTVDNFRFGAPPVAAPAIPGKFVMNLNAPGTDVTLGTGAGEYGVPTMEGLPARNNLGEAADVGTLVINSPDSVNVNAPILASTGINGAGTTFGGRGGNVQINSDAAINVNAAVKVSESSVVGNRASRAGGRIALTSQKTAGTAISISNTGELLSLLNAAAPGPGGTVQVTSAGGDILINGKVVADRGTVDIRNNGPSGQIFLNSTAHLAADVVKVGALGTNGQLTVNAGSQISAVNTLKLYGGTGSLGKVAFTGSGTVNLSGSQIHIRANTVEISGSTNVNNNGATAVHATNHNYNATPGNGGGQFRNPVTQGPASGAPDFD